MKEVSRLAKKKRWAGRTKYSLKSNTPESPNAKSGGSIARRISGKPR